VPASSVQSRRFHAQTGSELVRTELMKPAMSGASCCGAAMRLACPPAVLAKSMVCTHKV